jgi:CRP/FNR family transcriptional regulator
MDINQHCKNCKYKSHLFDKLSDEELVFIHKNKQTVEVKRGAIISKSGEPIREFIYLIEGLAKLQKVGKNGKEQIISLARPLDFIGLLSIFSKDTYEYTVTALVDSVVCKINIDSMRKMVQMNGMFSMDILKYISTISDEIIRTTYAINSKNLRGRIALLLVDFSQRYFQSNSFDLPLSRKEMAEMIDMTPENVIRILSEFRRDNIINVRGKHIEILNMNLLLKIRDLG